MKKRLHIEICCKTCKYLKWKWVIVYHCKIHDKKIINIHAQSCSCWNDMITKPKTRTGESREIKLSE